jgi:hypothetical protein
MGTEALDGFWCCHTEMLEKILVVVCYAADNIGEKLLSKVIFEGSRGGDTYLC